MKQFQIIYADPPWTFKTYSQKGKGRSPENHYSCMSIEQIKRLPVSNIASKDCVLFLWVTFPLLVQGLETIESWGFKYKTCGFNWVKRNKKSNSFFMGLGYWTRSNSELCLIATKGKPKRVSASVHQIIDSRIESHSKKPDIVRSKIEQLLGDIPRIELFARQKTEGWSVWGDEIESDIEFYA
tara:strand:- start:579 stop:1127 length:549 start_codon:yes stop_codon:yes gene_type:complete